ncbi:hypothetical protein LTR85_006581 [Meristemomyces frigidus]|nr:hypothetical protein LTR85_006581 [Meristemomyces frigidus]
MAATQQVLDTYELLENILLRLPLRQLLLAQRVNTGFRDLIWRSSKINRTLFFTPNTAETVDWYPPEGGGNTIRPILNPFLPVYETSKLTAVTRSAFRGFQRGIDYDDNGSSTVVYGPQHLAFSTPPRRFFCDYWDRGCQWRAYVDREVTRTHLLSRWEELMESSSGSFMHMLVTHPPCRTTKILTDVRLPQPYYYFAQDVWVEEEDCGVRFGPFLSAAVVVSTEQRVWHKENFANRDDTNTVEVVGGESWQLCPKSVDEMTGWEMLRLLAIGIDAFVSEMP